MSFRPKKIGTEIVFISVKNGTVVLKDCIYSTATLINIFD